MFPTMPGVLGMEKIFSSILLNKQWFLYIGVDISKLNVTVIHFKWTLRVCLSIEFHRWPGLPFTCVKCELKDSDQNTRNNLLICGAKLAATKPPTTIL